MESWAGVLSVCGKFVLAVLLAGAIGMERQLKGHAAGLRTHILVCLGSTLMMIVSNEIAQELVNSGMTVWLDKGRIAAGIITGIGFLGAGAIINIGSMQRGLTTAAMIWLVAGIGIAIGAGYWPLAVCATLFALLTVIGLEYVEQRLPEYERLTLTVRMPRGQDNFREIEQVVGSKGFKVAASRVRVDAGDKHSDMTFDLTATGGVHIEELTEFLEARFPSAERITFERS
jgi:putative Mg2+ transporter-C (MgtC) family protein